MPVLFSAAASSNPALISLVHDSEPSSQPWASFRFALGGGALALVIVALLKARAVATRVLSPSKRRVGRRNG